MSIQVQSQPLPMTLSDINRDFTTALDRLESIEEELRDETTTEERRAELAGELIAANEAFEQVISEQVRKVEGVIGAIRFFEGLASTAKAEAQRIDKLAKRWEERSSRIKASAPQLDLRVPIFLSRLMLIKPLQRAIHPLVEFPSTENWNDRLFRFFSMDFGPRF